MGAFFSALTLLPVLALAASPKNISILHQETRKHLKALIHLDTSNPPGNEILAAAYLKAQLDDEDVPSEIYTSRGTRSSLIGRLKGSGKKRPLILMCHTDVVPADRSEWSTNPFAPVEKDGYLYGRGAADIKCMCAAELAIMLWLKRSKTPLVRDVIFFAQADEESGGSDRHIDWLLKNHAEALDAEFAINEGGKTIWKDGRIEEILVQAAEKEYVDLTLTASGLAGHSSIPRPDNAVAALSKAVARLSDYRSQVEVHAIVREFLETQAKTASPELQSAIRKVLSASPGEMLNQAADQLTALAPELGAMLRDTLTPTQLKAGYKSNVIPATAEAVFNARLLPGRSPKDFVRGLKSLIQNLPVEIRFEYSGSVSIPPMPTDTPLYAAIQAAAKEEAPNARVMPFLSAWSTDSQALRGRRIVVYGLDPPLSAEDEDGVHGKNERILLKALEDYTQLLLSVVLKTASL